MDRRRQYSSCSSHSRDKDSSRCSCHPRLFRFASIVFGVLLLIDTIRSDIVGNLDHVVEGNQIHPTTTTTTRKTNRVLRQYDQKYDNIVRIDHTHSIDSVQEKKKEREIRREIRIVELTISDFDETIGNTFVEGSKTITTTTTTTTTMKTTWLIQFYAPWCRKSKNIMPIVDTVSTIVAEDVRVARVDADRQVALAKRFGIDVHALPVLYVVAADGSTHLFDKTPTVDDIIAFLEEGHANETPIHFLRSPMTAWWRVAFVPVAWLTARYGHMEAIFYSYLIILAIVSVTFLIFVNFAADWVVCFLIERERRRRKKDA